MFFMKIKFALFIVICIIFSACASKNFYTEQIEFNSENNNNAYKIQESFIIPTELFNTWTGLIDEKYYHLTLFNDNTFYLQSSYKNSFFIGVYYIYSLDKKQYIEFYARYVINKISGSNNRFICKEIDISEPQWNFQFDIIDNKLYFSEHTRLTKCKPVLYFPIKMEVFDINENKVLNGFTLKIGREKSKKAFLDFNVNEYEEFNKKINGRHYKKQGFDFIIHNEKPKNWASNLKEIRQYNFVSSISRKFSGERYAYNTAYQINTQNTILQWIDDENCLLFFSFGGSVYQSYESDVYWCHVKDLGKIGRVRSFDWNYKSRDSGKQLFFEYLGQKKYITTSGFEKIVPELRLFYTDASLLKDDVYTLKNRYLFFEIYQLSY